MRKMLADLGFEAVTLDESVEPGEKLQGKDDVIFREAIVRADNTADAIDRIEREFGLHA